MSLQKLQQLQDIVLVETRKAEELRKGTLYIIDSEGRNIASQIITEHERKAKEAAAALAAVRNELSTGQLIA